MYACVRILYMYIYRYIHNVCVYVYTIHVHIQIHTYMNIHICGAGLKAIAAQLSGDIGPFQQQASCEKELARAAMLCGLPAMIPRFWAQRPHKQKDPSCWLQGPTEVSRNHSL